MAKYHIIVSDPVHESGWEALRAAPDVTFSGPFPTRAETLAALQGADALIVRSATMVDAGLLAAAQGLKVVARAGAPLDNIDLDLATRLGILVLHAPYGSVIAVAEHTFAMLLALARSLPASDRAVRAGDWPRHATLGFELHGKTLGILGFGRLGRAVAVRAQAFGMQVLVYDPYVDLSLARAQGVEMVDFWELLERVDVLSLHTAHTPQTHHILNAASFARLKPSAYLVNCTNAGLVDEAALLAALESGRLAGAALDTFEQEPLPPGSPLLQRPEVLVAPHLNQNTIEAQTATSRGIVEDVLAALRGEDYRNAANLPFHEALPYRAVRPYIDLARKLGKLQGQLAEGWIDRIEVELLGEALQDLVRPVTAVLLSGMLLPVDGRPANWISAPVLSYEQGIAMSRERGLVQLEDYPNLIACRISWPGGSRTVAGTLFGNGEARLVQYDRFHVDAYPEGYVLVLENADRPGVIGKVGVRLGQAGVNIAQWRYGREARGGRAVSFINLDSRPSRSLLAELEQDPEIFRARVVRL